MIFYSSEIIYGYYLLLRSGCNTIWYEGPRQSKLCTWDQASTRSQEEVASVIPRSIYRKDIEAIKLGEMELNFSNINFQRQLRKKENMRKIRYAEAVEVSCMRCYVLDLKSVMQLAWLVDINPTLDKHVGSLWSIF